MPNQETSWTTVSGKPKGKVTTSSNKSSTTTGNTAAAMPKAEVKTIQLSDSAFSAMKSRIEDDDDSDREHGRIAKPMVNNPEKVAASKIPKATNGKASSTSLPLKQTLQNINGDKLKELNASSKEKTPLLIEKICYWFVEQLKDVTSGFQDPLFSKDTNSEYPINALPTKVRSCFDEVFSDSKSRLKGLGLCQKGLLQPNTDLNFVGAYQILLQYFLRKLDENDLQTLLPEIEELGASLKRFPSDKVLRLLWAFSQVQHQQAASALQIWFRLMCPLIENRTYNPFVIETLSQLTNRNSKSKKFLSSTDLFPIDSYLKLIEFVDRPSPALTKDLRSSLLTSTTILCELFCNNGKNLLLHGNEYFGSLFSALSGDKNRTLKTQTMIDRMILSSMVDKSLLQLWFDLHKKSPSSSANLLSLLQTNGTTLPGLSSPKEIRSFIQKLRQISSENNEQSEHEDFVEAYGKKENVIVTKRRSKSKSGGFSSVRLIFLLLVSFLVYRNWLWLTVATDYLLEDYMKHPTAIVIKQNIDVAFEQMKTLSQSSLKYVDEYSRSTLTQLEPHALRFRQYLQKQSSLFLKYLEGPVYDKSIEIAEEVQKMSMIIFQKSVRYLNIFFERASLHTTQLVDITGVYLKEVNIFLYNQWINFDGTKLREKFDELRLRLVKSF